MGDELNSVANSEQCNVRLVWRDDDIIRPDALSQGQDSLPDLFSQAEALNDFLIALEMGVCKITQERITRANHLEQAAA